jgi:NADPH-dependent 2,4-dienoyl-CoA reductase/sulfur reductase-like enzyme/nitrite reductase/ring-hydroxylating ferredoxin subunit
MMPAVSDSTATLTGPDLGLGIDVADVPVTGLLLGHAHGEAVLLVRVRDEFFAIAPTCTHYGGPLSEGRCEGAILRCPWHHARFDVRTGIPVAAPALNPLARWQVERQGSRIVVGAGLGDAPIPPAPAKSPASVVIIGAGAAGNAAAEMLRREGYRGPVTLIGEEANVPVDRPNLSKDYLAGTAPEDWVPLHGRDFYEAMQIDLVTGVKVTALDGAARTVQLSSGEEMPFGALLLATGAEPIPLPLSAPGETRIHSLRSLADSRAIIARVTAKPPASTVVVGASFIGLEVAASLRARGLVVHVVGREDRPLERVLGRDLSDFVRALHEEHGVRFHLGRTVRDVGPGAVTLDDGSRLAADLIVAGIGVRPRLGLAEQAGLRVDRGVVVNEFLETSAPGIYAAGDIARFTDPRTRRSVRIEHWVVAERMGQTAARNMLGKSETFASVPFFWSQHYDVAISYLGHAESWDRAEVVGSILTRDCIVAFHKGDRIDAIATIYRDGDRLDLETLLERDDQAGLRAFLKRAK